MTKVLVKPVNEMCLKAFWHPDLSFVRSDFNIVILLLAKIVSFLFVLELFL
jgi:hypothetical protein